MNKKASTKIINPVIPYLPTITYTFIKHPLYLIYVKYLAVFDAIEI